LASVSPGPLEREPSPLDIDPVEQVIQLTLAELEARGARTKRLSTAVIGGVVGVRFASCT